MVDRGFTDRYDYALQTLQELPSTFGGISILRIPCVLCAAAARGGFCQGYPDQVIANHTNWRFLNEIKRELKT